MTLENYLDRKYIDLLYENYEEFYLNLIDMENFDKVYNLLKECKFECIEDIILNYIEIFNVECDFVKMALDDIHTELGDDYQSKIKKDLRLFEKVLNLAIDYSEKE